MSGFLKQIIYYEEDTGFPLSRLLSLCCDLRDNWWWTSKNRGAPEKRAAGVGTPGQAAHPLRRARTGMPCSWQPWDCSLQNSGSTQCFRGVHISSLRPLQSWRVTQSEQSEPWGFPSDGNRTPSGPEANYCMTICMKIPGRQPILVYKWQMIPCLPEVPVSMYLPKPQFPPNSPLWTWRCTEPALWYLQPGKCLPWSLVFLLLQGKSLRPNTVIQLDSFLPICTHSHWSFLTVLVSRGSELVGFRLTHLDEPGEIRKCFMNTWRMT